MLAGLENPRTLVMGRAGRVMARPWLDRTILSALHHVVFPMSRAWAAAGIADGDLERFAAETGVAAGRIHAKRLDRALAKRARAAERARERAAVWQDALFDGHDPGAAARREIEVARLDAANALNGTRRHFAFLLPQRVRRAKLVIDTPGEISARYGVSIDRQRLLTLPEILPEPQESRPVAMAASVDTWLRFSAPRAGDIAYARVHTPVGVSHPPTVIMGHGICIAFDHWHGIIDETRALVQQGIRVIRPEAPWHGRRTPVGYYSGERAVGHFPSGQLDLYAHALSEWATLARWARATSKGAVGFGGMSLGALFAQLAASLAEDWPMACRPDALYLITHSDRMSVAITEGALSTLWEEPAHAEARGWTVESARQVLAALDMTRAPGVPASAIVSVLGRRDVITPYPTGAELVRRWHVPDANLFSFDNGHFTVPMRLATDGRATARFATLLKAASTR